MPMKTKSLCTGLKLWQCSNGMQGILTQLAMTQLHTPLCDIGAVHIILIYIGDLFECRQNCVFF